MLTDRQKVIEREAYQRSDPEFLNDSYIEGFIDGATWSDINISKENIIKILEIYNNLPNKENLEEVAEIILSKLEV